MDLIVWKGCLTFFGVAFLFVLRFLPDKDGDWPRDMRLFAYLWIPFFMVAMWAEFPFWVYGTGFIGLWAAVRVYLSLEGQA